MRLLRHLLALLGILAVLVVLFHLEENWRGRRAWETWKAAQEAAGQSYDPAAYHAGKIPDSDNFAAAPVFALSSERKEALATADLPASCRVAIQGERCAFAYEARHLDEHPWKWQEHSMLGTTVGARRWLQALLVPRGWAFQVLVAKDRAAAQVQAALGVPGQRIPALGSQDLPKLPFPYNQFVGNELAPVFRYLRRLVAVQASLDQARVACALERFRLARGSLQLAKNCLKLSNINQRSKFNMSACDPPFPKQRLPLE